MGIEEIVGFVEGLGDVVVQRPGPGDGTPEAAWGDVFVYHSPDGTIPAAQPIVTIVTKDYPGEPSSGLDREGSFRLNLAPGREEFARVTGHEPKDAPAPADPTARDVLMAHPVYGPNGWLAVVDPGPATEAEVRELLRSTHRLAAQRHRRRAETREP